MKCAAPVREPRVDARARRNTRVRSVREVAAYVHRAWQAVFHARYAMQRLEKAGRGEEDANGSEGERFGARLRCRSRAGWAAACQSRLVRSKDFVESLGNAAVEERWCEIGDARCDRRRCNLCQMKRKGTLREGVYKQRAHTARAQRRRSSRSPALRASLGGCLRTRAVIATLDASARFQGGALCAARKAKGETKKERRIVSGVPVVCERPIAQQTLNKQCAGVLVVTVVSNCCSFRLTDVSGTKDTHTKMYHILSTVYGTNSLRAFIYV